MSYSVLPSAALNDPGPLLPTGWRRWFSGTNGVALQAGVSSVTAIACGTLRYLNLHRSVNGLTTIGLGVCIPPFVGAFFPKKFESRTFQVLQTVFGMGSFFLITQLGANYPGTEAAVIAATAGILGVNLSLMVRRFIDNPKGLQASEPMADVQNAPKLTPFSLPLPSWSDYAWKSAAVGLGGYAWSAAASGGNLMYRGLASWLTCYYLGDMVGRTVHIWVSRKIQKGIENRVEISVWRTVERVTNTFSYFMISVAMIPWTSEPKTAAREHQLWITGLIAGCLCGYLKRAQRKELETQPIGLTSAFRTREKVKNLGFKVWQVAWPILTFSGVIAFIVSQVASNELELKDKISIGVMMPLGYLFASGRALAINGLWKVAQEAKEQTLSFKRRVLHSLVITQMNPLFLGISPANLYYLGANVLEMSNGQTFNKEQQLLDWASWFFYGLSMGTEFGQTCGKMEGSIYGLPTFLIMNGVLTSATYFRGA